MKRYIKSNDFADYSIEIFPRAGQDMPEGVEASLREILAPASQYIDHVLLDLSYTGNLRVFSNQRVPQIKLTSSAKNVDKCIAALFKRLQADLPGWIQQHEKTAQVKSMGLTKVSAMTLVSRLIKQEFGFNPTFRYSDSGTLLYMQYDLPFAEEGKFKLDRQAGEQLASEFDTFLTEVKNTYNLDMYWQLPIGGPIRSAWEVVVSKRNGDFVYDTKTKTYSRM